MLYIWCVVDVKQRGARRLWGWNTNVTFSEVRTHFPPQRDVGVEDDSLLVHADTLQPQFTPKPRRVLRVLQHVIHRRRPETRFTANTRLLHANYTLITHVHTHRHSALARTFLHVLLYFTVLCLHFIILNYQVNYSK